MDKIIRIACKGYTELDYTHLHDFQGELKTLTVDNYERLKKQIVETGFAFAEHAWHNKEDDKWYIVDGHQRLRTIKQMVEQEGWTCPPLPVVPVEAGSLKEAKLRVLQGTSQYGHMQGQGLYEFMTLNEITPEQISLNFDLPHIDLDSFKAEYYTDTKEEMPPIGSEPKSPFRAVTFTLHEMQWEKIERALIKAKDSGKAVSDMNENSNGNALELICDHFQATFS